MSILESLILGIIQGITEFIPVSSSGHLLLAHEILGNDGGSTLAFDVALHVGTLFALLIFFRADILSLLRNILKQNKEGRLARLLLLATIPAGLAGLLLGDFIDEKLRSSLVVAITLVTVGIVMLLVDRKANSESDRGNEPGSNKEISTKQGLFIGLAQITALVPGVSRSGATITTGIYVGLDHVKAARFSFLLAIPIIAGSALGILAKNSNDITFGSPLLVGMVAAFVSGILAIKFLLKVIGKYGLKPFAYYRIALAFIVFATLL